MPDRNSPEDRIIKACVDLVKSSDAEQIQVNEICEAAGVSKGTFYKYFKSKDNLFSQLYLSMEPRIIEKLPDILLKDISPLQQFWLVFCYFIERTIELGPKGVKYIARAGFTENGTHAFLSRGTNLWDIFISLLKKSAAAGIIRDDCDAELLLEHLSLIVVGVNIQWSASNGSFDYKEKLFRHFMLLLGVTPDFGPYDGLDT